MTFDTVIIDLLGELDLDLPGFEDASPEGSLLFPLGFSNDSEAFYNNSEASISAVCLVLADDDLPPFELLGEPELGPRKWIAAGPPAWDSTPEPEPIATPMTLCQTFTSLTVGGAPRTPSRSQSRPLPKENMRSPPEENMPSASPTKRSFGRNICDRSSNLAIRAFNYAPPLVSI